MNQKSAAFTQQIIHADKLSMFLKSPSWNEHAEYKYSDLIAWLRLSHILQSPTQRRNVFISYLLACQPRCATLIDFPFRRLFDKEKTSFINNLSKKRNEWRCIAISWATMLSEKSITNSLVWKLKVSRSTLSYEVYARTLTSGISFVKQKQDWFVMCCRRGFIPERCEAT